MIVSKIISTIADGARTLKVLCFGKSDVRTPAECAPYGYDGNPIEGAKCIYSQTTTNGQDVIIGYVNTNQIAEPGESRIFSTDTSGAIKFNIWLQGSGDVLIGDSVTPGDYTNHLTQFEALKSGIEDYLNNPATGLLFCIQTGIASAGGAFTPPSPIDIDHARTKHIKVQ